MLTLRLDDCGHFLNKNINYSPLAEEPYVIEKYSNFKATTK